MKHPDFGVEQWVELFRDVGLDEGAMREWHREFESRYPERHRAFLEWLGLPAERIESIRRGDTNQ